MSLSSINWEHSDFLNEAHGVGVVNAGLLDQTSVLQWVQNYIYLFGGNNSQVNIDGESVGWESVMLQAIAYDGTSLFSDVSDSSFVHRSVMRN